MRTHLIVAMMLVSGAALAGALKTKDRAGLLTPTDRSALEASVSGLPFDVNLLIEDSPSKGALETAVGKAVTGPRVLAVGLDPAHHFTSVHFGDGLGILSGDWNAISRAGNPSFRQRDWAGGVAAIGRMAQSKMGTSTTVTASPALFLAAPSPEPPVKYMPKAEESHTGLWILGVFIVCMLALWLLVRWLRRDERAAATKRKAVADVFATSGAAPPQRPRYVDPDPVPRRRPATRVVQPIAPAPVAVRPAPVVIHQPPPVIVQQPAVVHHHHDRGGSGDLATGLVLGHMLTERGGHSDHHHVERTERIIERETVREAPRSSSSDWSANDAGGASSSWSSSDSGGSSSSWSDSSSSSSSDSGSSSSCDSGGGSSDW